MNKDHNKLTREEWERLTGEPAPENFDDLVYAPVMTPEQKRKHDEKLREIDKESE